MSFSSSCFDFLVLAPVYPVACYIEILSISEGGEQSRTKQNVELLYCCSSQLLMKKVKKPLVQDMVCDFSLF